MTHLALTGEMDFEKSLRERVAMLKGLDQLALTRVFENITLTSGARTFIRTLKRLGMVTAIVSAGFTRFTNVIAADLGIDYSLSNTLVDVDGVLTGESTGEFVDGPRKARFLESIAEAEGIPLSQVVAVGDGANDLDMLAAAGLGIAFNAKPVVRERADTAISVPYLDAILFIMGIQRQHVEDADARIPASRCRTGSKSPGSRRFDCRPTLPAEAPADRRLFGRGGMDACSSTSCTVTFGLGQSRPARAAGAAAAHPAPLTTHGEELAAGAVHSFEGVGPEEVPLSLDQVGGEPLRSHRVEIGRGRWSTQAPGSRPGPAPATTWRQPASASRNALAKNSSSDQVGQPGIPEVGGGDVVEERGPDDATRPPDRGDAPRLQVPIVLLRSRPHQSETLGIGDDLRGVEGLSTSSRGQRSGPGGGGKITGWPASAHRGRS